MPSGIARISTKKVETTVSWICCHRAFDTCPFDSAFSEIGSRWACRTTFASRAGRDMPMLFAASTSAGSTPRRPTIVLRATGSSPHSVSAITVGGTPRPAIGTSRPIMASEGMVRMEEVEEDEEAVVVARWPAQSLRQMTTPITTPMSVATAMHWKTTPAWWYASESSC